MYDTRHRQSLKKLQRKNNEPFYRAKQIQGDKESIQNFPFGNREIF